MLFYALSEYLRNGVVKKFMDLSITGAKYEDLEENIARNNES